MQYWGMTSRINTRSTRTRGQKQVLVSKLSKETVSKMSKGQTQGHEDKKSFRFKTKSGFLNSRFEELIK